MYTKTRRRTSVDNGQSHDDNPHEQINTSKSKQEQRTSASPTSNSFFFFFFLIRIRFLAGSHSSRSSGQTPQLMNDMDLKNLVPIDTYNQIRTIIDERSQLIHQVCLSLIDRLICIWKISDGNNANTI